MITLEQIQNHAFLKELLQDGEQYLSEITFSNFDIEIPKENMLDEFQYYVHNVGFYTTYFLKWLKQLEMGVEFLSNFDYRIKSNFNRIDHLAYNLENYIIRYQSVSDRLFQIINSVFHLTNDESNVNYNIVMNNLKVKRTKIPSKFKPLKNYLNKFNYERNTIVHRHSYLEKDLRWLENMYFNNKFENDIIESEIKYFRSRYLRDYLKNKKDLLNKSNEELFELIPCLFDELLIEYKFQRNKLKKMLNK